MVRLRLCSRRASYLNMRYFTSYWYHVTCSLQAFSFSAMYSDKSLDIVCANREEFDVWTYALQVGY